MQNQSAFHRAQHLITELVEQYRARGLVRLPSLSVLARYTGCSRRTAAAAVAELKRRAILFSRPGAGLYVQPPPPPSAVSPPPVPAFDRAYRQLLRDVLTGTHDDMGVLPPMAELCERCGAGARAVRQALHHLVREGLVKRERRRWVTAGVCARTCSGIAVILRADENGDLGGCTPRTYTMLRELESICRQRGLRLELLGFSYRQEPLFYRRLSEIERRLLPLGYLLWTVGLEGGGELEQTRRIVSRLADFGKPIAVLRETSPSFPLDQWVPHVPTRLCAMACTARDGEIMGHYLLRLGRRPLTILLEEGDTDSGPKRIEGIRRVYRRAGCEHLVHVERLASRRSLGRRAEEARAWAERNAARLPSDVVAFMRTLSGLSAIAFREAAVERAYEPEYGRVFAERGSGIWVGLNDPIALGALRFLSDRGVDIPGRIALVGFDDSPSAFLRGLTSFNFATREVIAMMVSHVLMPKRQSNFETGELVLDGFVSERRTTPSVARRFRHIPA